MRMKIYELNGTTVVRLPREYVIQYGIRKAGFIDLREDESGRLVISPMEVTKQ